MQKSFLKTEKVVRLKSSLYLTMLLKQLFYGYSSLGEYFVTEEMHNYFLKLLFLVLLYCLYFVDILEYAFEISFVNVAYSISSLTPTLFYSEVSSFSGFNSSHSLGYLFFGVTFGGRY